MRTLLVLLLLAAPVSAQVEGDLDFIADSIIFEASSVQSFIDFYPLSAVFSGGGGFGIYHHCEMLEKFNGEMPDRTSCNRFKDIREEKGGMWLFYLKYKKAKEREGARYGTMLSDALRRNTPMTFSEYP
jgi:hypothetical protein